MNIQVSEVLELLKSQWNNIPMQYMILIRLAGTVFALLNCFMGYRLRKVWGCILGVLAGAGGGAAAGYYFLQDQMLALVCGAAGALFLGLLAWLLYKFGVFVMCTGLLYGMILSLFSDASMTQHIIALVIGVFGGTLALGYEKQMVVGITALCGGMGGIHLLLAMTGKDAGAGEWILGLILAVIGAVIQWAPFMKDKDWEAKLFHLSPGRKRKAPFMGRRKKIVKEKRVVHVNQGKNSSPKTEAKQAFKEEPKEELDRTQEYKIGQRQYEQQRRYKEMPYMAPGMGIDLDDLNRELSQEIKKIYEDDSQE